MGANVGGIVGVVGEVKVLEIRKLLQYMATSSEWRQLCDPIPLFEQEVRRDSKPVQPTSSSQICPVPDPNLYINENFCYMTFLFALCPPLKEHPGVSFTWVM